MSGVKHKIVCSCSKKLSCSVKNVLGNAYSRTADKTSARVLCGVRILGCLLDILYSDKSLKLVISVNYRELLDLMLSEYLLRVCKGCSLGSGNKVVLCHNVCDTNVEVNHKAHIAVGDYTDNALLIVTYRNARNSELIHKGLSLVNIVVSAKEYRVGDNSVFASLNSVNLISLSLNGHILMYCACSALSCKSNSKSRFGNGVHRRTHNGNIKRNFVCESCLQRNICRKNVTLCGNEKNIVKRKTFFYKLRTIIHKTSLLLWQHTINDYELLYQNNRKLSIRLYTTF